MKLCSKCKVNERTRTKDTYCTECRKAIGAAFYLKHKDKAAKNKAAYYRNNKAAAKTAARKCRLQKKYGLSLEEFATMEHSQGGLCAICSTPGRVTRGGIKLAVDHCHKTGKIRQLLCFNCNALLGQCDDSPEILLKAIEYLSRHV